MIPNAIVLGFIGGLLPGSRWWPIPVIGVLWSIMLTVGGDPSMSFAQIWIGGLALGAVNAAVGLAFGRGIAKVIQVSTDWSRAGESVS